jgi:hypothetical protein
MEGVYFACLVFFCPVSLFRAFTSPAYSLQLTVTDQSGCTRWFSSDIRTEQIVLA